MTEITLQEDLKAIKTVTSIASYWVPRHLLHSAWLEHGPFAFWLVDAIRPRTIVELGTHNGYSFFAFCQAVESLGIQCSCHAVDTWQGDEHAGFYDNEIYEGVSSIQQKYYANIATLIRAKFEDARAYFADGSVDLLHIDGRHSYEDVLTDYVSWLPKLSPSAIVLFHDTNVRERNFGVWKLWSELKEKFPSFEFIHGNGLGVLSVGEETPEGLRPLFAAARTLEGQSLVRAAYSRLGKACSQEYFFTAQARAAAEKIQSAERIIDMHAAKLAAFETSASLEESRLLEYKIKLTNCEAAVATATEKIEALSSRLAHQRIAIELQAREKYLVVKRLKEEVVELQQQHPLALRVGTWTRAHPRRARWAWAGLRVTHLLVTLQLGRLARAAAARIRSS